MSRSFHRLNTSPNYLRNGPFRFLMERQRLFLSIVRPGCLDLITIMMPTTITARSSRIFESRRSRTPVKEELWVPIDLECGPENLPRKHRRIRIINRNKWQKQISEHVVPVFHRSEPGVPVGMGVRMSVLALLVKYWAGESTCAASTGPSCRLFPK